MTTSGVLRIYYDGACPLCSKEIATYRRMPAVAPVQWVDASVCLDAELGEGLTRAQALQVLHARLPDGTLVQGVDAFIQMWAALKPMACWAKLASKPPIHRLLGAGYRTFLKVRPLWRAPGQTNASCSSGTCHKG